jgi:hypothetical protein
MPNRIEPLNLITFTGGLNLRRNQFELADNESPDLLNVDIDPRGGFYTRKGWQRWNRDDVVDVSSTAWEPRNAWAHVTSAGDQYVYVVNNHVVYRSNNTGTFIALSGLNAQAAPHQADFTAWGNDVYVAAGITQSAARISAAGLVTMLDDDAFSEVDAPTNDMMPRADFTTTHAGYLFVAVTNETDGIHATRVRWSHPGVPDAFRNDDYLDIDAGGGRITGLMSFQDHLLIFKSSTMWALYGYDESSWQLIQVSTKTGCPTVTAMTRSETTAYFASSTDLGGIYAYQGGQPIYLSEALRPAFEQFLNFDNVFVSWCAQRLWVSVPWINNIGATQEPTSVFVFDPTIGQGAWTMYRSNYGALALAIDNSDVTGRHALGAFWSDQAACLVLLDYIDDAYDVITETPVLGTQNSLDNIDAPYLVTGNNEEIQVGGERFVGQPFDSYYRTKWLHAGWPERKKSWRRPTFICREVSRNTDLLVETYRDYNETNIYRTRTLRLRVRGGAFWSEEGFDARATTGTAGFDWKELGAADPSGRGADWGSERRGSQLVRAGTMGLARAVQLRVRASPNTQRQKWGIDAIVAKIVMRRFH